MTNFKIVVTEFGASFSRAKVLARLSFTLRFRWICHVHTFLGWDVHVSNLNINHTRSSSLALYYSSTSWEILVNIKFDYAIFTRKRQFRVSSLVRLVTPAGGGRASY